MKSISELLRELDTLPPGNIYKKYINGNTYYYHQYFEFGKRISKLVPNDKLVETLELFKKKKDIQEQIRQLRSFEKNITISNHADQLTGQIMCGDIPVASFENGVMISYHEKLAPLVIQRTHSIRKFLALRVIDMDRTNARLLARSLNINIDDEHKIPLYSYALTIGDNYWFKPKQSKIKYDDIKFNNDNFFDTSLKGTTIYFKHRSSLTPELTTTGSFEKGWRLIKKHWWLYKSGEDKNIFSELFCFNFAKLIGLKTAIYEYDNGYIRSKNFAEKYNFEPMASLADSNDNYSHLFTILYNLNKAIAKEYIKLIFFDAVVHNVDRHNENTGLLRNKDTGRIVSLAPNFDNNLALLATVDTIKKDIKQDGFAQQFIKFMHDNMIAYQMFNEIIFKDISIKEIQKCIDDVPIKLKNTADLAEAIYLRYKSLKNLL